jgi:hypothetical protein
MLFAACSLLNFFSVCRQFLSSHFLLLGMLLLLGSMHVCRRRSCTTWLAIISSYSAAACCLLRVYMLFTILTLPVFFACATSSLSVHDWLLLFNTTHDYPSSRKYYIFACSFLCTLFVNCMLLLLVCFYCWAGICMLVVAARAHVLHYIHVACLLRMHAILVLCS